jgi:hypothetical protein
MSTYQVFKRASRGSRSPITRSKGFSRKITEALFSKMMSTAKITAANLETHCRSKCKKRKTYRLTRLSLSTFNGVKNYKQSIIRGLRTRKLSCLTWTRRWSALRETSLRMGTTVVSPSLILLLIRQMARQELIGSTM